MVIDSQEEIKWGLTVKAGELIDLVKRTENYIHECLDGGVNPRIIDDAMRDVVRNSEYVSDDSELIAKFFDHIAEKIEV